MTATILKLLPDDEILVLESYISDMPTYHLDARLDEIFETLGIPEESSPERIAVAVAQIILNPIQHTLPNFAICNADHSVTLCRTPHNRHKDARLNFHPQQVCTINWADSGPGYSWPEAYHVTYLPGFNKYIVTASRDGTDVWGCVDHAIGIVDGGVTPIAAAKVSILDYWGKQVYDWNQDRWAYLFDEGLIDIATANTWADEVWQVELLEEDEECQDE
jgi:hypothetical protein